MKISQSMNPMISVIVPIYKVEKYLRACIDSILVQTYENLEIILVDDGSPDGCGSICDEYRKKDQRIIVIHQENYSWFHRSYMVLCLEFLKRFTERNNE